MAGMPLQLGRCKFLLPGDAAADATPPPRAEVLRGCSSGDGEEGVPLMSFSELKLRGSIERYRKMISCGTCKRLPDGGEKIRKTLRRMEEELDRRKHVKDNGEGRTFMEVKTTSSTRLANESGAECAAASSCTRSSDAFLTSDESVVKTGAVCSTNLSSTDPENHRQQKRIVETTSLERRSPSKISVVLSKPSLETTRFDSKDEHYSDKQRLGISGFYDPGNVSRQGGNCSSIFSKRKRGYTECKDSSDVQWIEAKKLVFLDEDDENIEKGHSVHQLRQCSEEGNKAKIYYPSSSDPEAVELSYMDIECLEPEAYLSSPIMNFYIRYLRSAPLIAVPSGEHYFFNTFFYQKLEKAILSKDDRDHFSRLRRWWKGINIFQKPYIFLPIHADLHWSLVVICFPEKEDESGPVILHLDSLGAHCSTDIFHVATSYLKEEWGCLRKDELPPDFPISEKVWRILPRRIDQKKVAVPRQKNVYDCGVFVLYYMEQFIKDYPRRLRRKDIEMIGSSRWFRPEDASNLRQRIRDLLMLEFEKAKTMAAENPRPTGPTGSPASAGR